MKIIEKIFIPKDNVNDELVLIKNIYVKDNDEVDKNTLIMDYETSKANFELFSKESGYIKIFCSLDDSIEVGSQVAQISDNPISEDNVIDESSNKNINTKFSKKALERIEQLNLDKSSFNKYSIVNEKIVSDIYKKMNDKNDLEEIFTLSPSKVAEVNNLTNNERLGLVSSVSKSFDATKINFSKYQYSNEFNGSVSLILIYVISKILDSDEYRQLNSFIHDSQIHYFDTINFGLALNLGDGLKVGVFHNSNKKSIKELDARAIELIDKYIDNKMDIDDISGCTVTLTDLTEKNIDSFTPIIIKNNSIMIGLCGEKGKKQKIIVTFDHRASDGLEISDFINNIVQDLYRI